MKRSCSEGSDRGFFVIIAVLLSVNLWVEALIALLSARWPGFWIRFTAALFVLGMAWVAGSPHKVAKDPKLGDS